LCALQDYIREIGCCLIQLPGQVGGVAQNRLHQLTFEAIRLIGRRVRLTADDGHRALTMGAKNKLKPEFYVHLLVSQVCCVVLQFADNYDTVIQAVLDTAALGLSDCQTLLSGH